MFLPPAARDSKDIQIEGLFNKVMPALQCCFCRRNFAVGSDHDGGGVRLVLLGQAENIQPSVSDSITKSVTTTSNAP